MFDYLFEGPEDGSYELLTMQNILVYLYLYLMFKYFYTETP